MSPAPAAPLLIPPARGRFFLRGAGWLGLVAIAILVVAFCLRRGSVVECRFLRIGGRMVLSAVQKPRRTAIVFSAILATTWCGVAIAAFSQRRAPHASIDDAQQPTPPQS